MRMREQFGWAFLWTSSALFTLFFMIALFGDGRTCISVIDFSEGTLEFLLVLLGFVAGTFYLLSYLQKEIRKLRLSAKEKVKKR